MSRLLAVLECYGADCKSLVLASVLLALANNAGQGSLVVWL